MSHQAASRIMDLAVRLGADQNQLLLDIQPLCSPEEYAQYRAMIANTMGSLLLEVINPIAKKYPDLRPAQLFSVD